MVSSSSTSSPRTPSSSEKDLASYRERQKQNQNQRNKNAYSSLMLSSSSSSDSIASSYVLPDKDDLTTPLPISPTVAKEQLSSTSSESVFFSDVSSKEQKPLHSLPSPFEKRHDNISFTSPIGNRTNHSLRPITRLQKKGSTSSLSVKHPSTDSFADLDQNENGILSDAEDYLDRSPLIKSIRQRKRASRKSSRDCFSSQSSAATTPSSPFMPLDSSDISILTSTKLNIQPAHIIESVLLIGPLIYAIYIRKRDSSLFSSVDALDNEHSLFFKPLTSRSAGSDPTSSPSSTTGSITYIRSTMVYDFKFLIKFLILMVSLMIGLYQEARVVLVSSTTALKPFTSLFNLFFPDILYTSVLPPLIALATNPQHLAFFHLNILATLAYIPFSLPENRLLDFSSIVSMSPIISARRISCALLEPTMPGIMDNVLSFQSAIQVIVQNSLTKVESFLLATMMVNLYHFASFNTFPSNWNNPLPSSLSQESASPDSTSSNSNVAIYSQLPDSFKNTLAIAATPAVVLKALIFGACLISVVPIWPFVRKIMEIERQKFARPQSEETREAYTSKQLSLAFKSLIVYTLTALLVVFPLFLSIEIPHKYTIASEKSAFDTPASKFISMFIGPINYIFYTVIFPSFEEFKEHLFIAGYWLAILAVTIPVVQMKSDSWSHVDLRRKVWHITVVAMFLPVGLPSHPTFTKLCVCIAIFLFLAVEFMRVTTIPPLGPQINVALLKYLDPRDTCGPIIVSHIFLLIGIGVPMLLCNSPAGIICLGLGDSAASVFGRMFGKHKWAYPAGNKKTIEGTIAFVVGATLGMAIYKWGVLAQLYPHIYNDTDGKYKYFLDTYNPFVSTGGLTLFKMVFVSTLTALLEAFSSMNDNVIVPLYMTALLQLC